MSATPRVDALVELIKKERGVDQPTRDGDPAGVALWRVLNLAEKWESATELGTGNPSIVARAFAAELRAAIAGDPAEGSV